MSFYNLYVGDASDPKFNWEGGDFSTTFPKPSSIWEGSA